MRELRVSLKMTSFSVYHQMANKGNYGWEQKDDDHLKHYWGRCYRLRGRTSRVTSFAHLLLHDKGRPSVLSHQASGAIVQPPGDPLIQN